MQVLVIDVMETPEDAAAYAQRWGFSFPVLLDRDGAVAASYAPEGVLPDLPRDQVVIASNLIIDRQGIIRFYTLLDTNSFDAKLVELKARLDEMLGE